jgi:NADH dehydrogenase
MTAGAARLPCHLIPLPDFVARIQAFVMGFMPGKPFSSDNYKSLTVDGVCREDGCASLGIRPAHMRGIIGGYLVDHSLRSRLDDYRRSTSSSG